MVFLTAISKENNALLFGLPVIKFKFYFAISFPVALKNFALGLSQSQHYSLKNQNARREKFLTK